MSSLKGDPLDRNARSRRSRLNRLQKELGKMSSVFRRVWELSAALEEYIYHGFHRAKTHLRLLTPVHHAHNPPL